MYKYLFQNPVFKQPQSVFFRVIIHDQIFTQIFLCAVCRKFVLISFCVLKSTEGSASKFGGGEKKISDTPTDFLLRHAQIHFNKYLVVYASCTAWHEALLERK
jgi:hypothetical protein